MQKNRFPNRFPFTHRSLATSDDEVDNSYISKLLISERSLFLGQLMHYISPSYPQFAKLKKL